MLLGKGWGKAVLSEGHRVALATSQRTAEHGEKAISAVGDQETRTQGVREEQDHLWGQAVRRWEEEVRRTI